MMYNLFVDESCHLVHDGAPVMVLGYVKVPQADYRRLFDQLKALKAAHGVKNELKWSRFSAKRLPLYMAMVDLFCQEAIQFRCILVNHKSRLRDDDMNQGSADNFYYKMAYYLLRPNTGEDNYRAFFDTKDTRGRDKLRKIREVLRNFNLGEERFVQLQHLRSHENPFFELTDLLIGAVAYNARLAAGNVPSNAARIEFIHYLQRRTQSRLDQGTPPYAYKFNIFNFTPEERP